MTIHSIDSRLILIPERQRRETLPEALVELAGSIERNGLIHPIVVRSEDGNTVLVAGERRLRAMQFIWAKGNEVRCGTRIFPDSFAPCNYIGELDPIDALEVEIEENIRREDFSWQDRSRATARLYDLRTAQAAAKEGPPPTVADIAEELAYSPASAEHVRNQLIVSRFLHDPDVYRATSTKEAAKIVKRKEELARSADLAARVGASLTRESHSLILGDCLEEMLKLPSASFDVILTDPPYGIEADDFGDSGGKTRGAHSYDDSYSSWTEMAAQLSIHVDRLAKPQAHLYLFCALDNYHELANRFTTLGWRVFRTPIIWINPTANRVPWPEHGPRRQWQMILYATKGNKVVTKIYPDVIQHPSDTNLNHHAQKPIGVYQNLLARSIQPGDQVLDPFCGSGTIFPAAHEFKCIATGIEIDKAFYGIAAERLSKL